MTSRREETEEEEEEAIKRIREGRSERKKQKGKDGDGEEQNGALIREKTTGNATGGTGQWFLSKSGLHSSCLAGGHDAELPEPLKRSSG